MRNLSTLINRHGDEDDVWYIDVRGVDQDGRTVWIGGNVLDQDECGYGGFHNYQTCKQIVDDFKFFVKYTPEAYRNASENDVTSFTPKVLYIGYAPLGDENNQLFKVREL